MDAGRQSLELRVLDLIKGAFKSREVWEAEYPEEAPIDDDRVMLQNWASTVHRQGILLADLALFPKTRAELGAEMPGIVNRAPAWLDAHLAGRQSMTLELFLQGLAQTLATQRAAFERVVAEQVVDPASIEEALAEAPVPAGTGEEERSDLIHGVSHALMAHTKALVELAYDLETQAARIFESED
jgi:hypothetical protein